MTQESIGSSKPTESLIPQYQGEVSTFISEEKNIPIHKGKTIWTFQHEDFYYQIPVFSIWDYNHHEEIAELIASGSICAMYMWGTYGTGALINSPEWEKREAKTQNNEQRPQTSEKLRSEIKKGRPKNMPFVPFMYPEDMIDFWDIDRFHRNYRHLQWAGARSKLYDSGPVHIIAPTKSRNPHVDNSMIRSADYTTSYFYMPHPGWERVIKMLRRAVKHEIFGGGSLNFHNEQPAFKTSGLYEELQQRPDWFSSIGLVIVDEIAESFDVDCGQTQIRLPQVNSDGKCEIVRFGALSPYTWSHETGYPVKIASDGVKFASSLKQYTPSSGLIIDYNLAMSKKAMAEYDQSAA